MSIAGYVDDVDNHMQNSKQTVRVLLMTEEKARERAALYKRMCSEMAQFTLPVEMQREDPSGYSKRYEREFARRIVPLLEKYNLIGGTSTHGWDYILRCDGISYSPGDFLKKEHVDELLEGLDFSQQ